MGSAAIAGKIAVVQIGDTVPPVSPTGWTDLAEVYEIPELPIVRNRYNTTFHDSSIYSSQTPGLIPPIDWVISCNYIQAQYDTFWGLLNSTTVDGPLQWFRLLWPDAYYHQFEAFVAGLTPATPLDERITYQVTLAVTQDITYDNS